jgi:hypothetical protein
LSASPNLSIEARTVLSYLEDAQSRLDREVNSQSNPYTAQSAGLAILTGDVALAAREALAARDNEREILEARCSAKRGDVYWAISNALRRFGLSGEFKGLYRTYMSEAGRSYLSAIRSDPLPEYHYSLGLIHLGVGNKPHAAGAFAEAAKSENPDVVIAARKELGRLGKVDQAPSGGQSAGGPSKVVEVHGTGFESKKVINWRLVGMGAAIFGVGVVTASYASVGAIVCLVGLGMATIGITDGKRVY